MAEESKTKKKRVVKEPPDLVKLNELHRKGEAELKKQAAKK